MKYIQIKTNSAFKIKCAASLAKSQISQQNKYFNFHILFPSLLIGLSSSINAATIDSDYIVKEGQTVDGFTFNKAGEITNNGKIFSPNTTAVNIAANGANVHLINNGDISMGGVDGITVLYTNTNGTIDNSGTFCTSTSQGVNNDAIQVVGNSTLTINNHVGGLISTGSGVSNITSSNGLEIGSPQSTVTINNDGTMNGTSAAVRVNDGAGIAHVNNNVTGSMSGSFFDTIDIISNSSVDNKGIIMNDQNSGIRMRGSNNTVINSGTITGGMDKYAISVVGDDNSITLDTGSSLGGTTAINSTGKKNTLKLQGTSSEDGNIIGISSLAVAKDSQWELSGNVNITGKTNESVNNAGVLRVNGKMDNIGGGTLIADGGTLIVGDSSHKVANLTSDNITINTGGTLSGYATVTGDVTNSGTIAAFNGMSTSVASQRLMTGTVLNPAGNLTIEGNLSNSGNIQLAGSEVGNTLTITGNYTGNDGTLTVNTALGNDTSATDKLIVKGDTSGNTNVIVKNLHGIGAQTINGIQIVSIDGLSGGDFKLQGRAVAGAYEYQLNKNGTDGDWYLLSTYEAPPTPEPTPEPNPQPQPIPHPQLRPEVGAYLGNLTAAQSMFVTTLYDRMGDSFRDASEHSDATWGHINGSHTRQDSANDALTTDTDTYAMELGGDILKGTVTGLDSWTIGIMAGIGNAKTKSRAAGVKSEAHSSVDGYNLGLYSTWFADEKNKRGLYIDSWAQYGWFNNSVQGDKLDEERYDSTNQTVSLETGYSFEFGHFWQKNWVFEPQAQVLYMHYQQDNHTESNGTKITDASGDGFITRLGGRITGELKGSVRPYTELNWWNGRPVVNGVTMDGVTNNTDSPENRYQMKVGLQSNLNSNLKVWSDIHGTLGENSYSEYGAMAGLSYNF